MIVYKIKYGLVCDRCKARFRTKKFKWFRTLGTLKKYSRRMKIGGGWVCDMCPKCIKETTPKGKTIAVLGLKANP